MYCLLNCIREKKSNKIFTGAVFYVYLSTYLYRYSLFLPVDSSSVPSNFSLHNFLQCLLQATNSQFLFIWTYCSAPFSLSSPFATPIKHAGPLLIISRSLRLCSFFSFFSLGYIITVDIILYV
jgi:hypothetical protein